MVYAAILAGVLLVGLLLPFVRVAWAILALLLRLPIYAGCLIWKAAAFAAGCVWAVVWVVINAIS
jgi:hypothetical protein